ncbi:hypothetical protein CALVIDRAFT_603540 [Calocera viscosa TUFC12733]|uniref:DUF6533 domain-containing protein n=1 Tax=Calocera viscosa (strain TUFC12733) TaxID=1330018 RepID=A0A167FLB8_CALVF|nr:hypothetical protein CALVIDRAFT_603540 [Calocera viscosa TUFC12733]
MDGLIAELTEYVSSSQLVVRWAVSALCLVTYDYFLTFEKERRFIWGAAWTPGTVLFIAIRYLPFIDLSLIIYDQTNPGASEGICTAVIWWYQFSCIIAIVLTDWVIGLRTWAIWGRSNVCAVLVAAAWIGATAGSLYFQVTALKEDTYYPTPAGFELPGCIFYTSDIATLTNMYTIYAVYETLIFIATLVRGVGHLRYAPAQLMSVLYRDGILFFLAILNIIMLKVSPNWAYGLTAIYRAMNAIMPERIILNLRETATGGTINGWDVMTEDPAHQKDSSGSGSNENNKRYGGRNRGERERAGIETELSVMNDV